MEEAGGLIRIDAHGSISVHEMMAHFRELEALATRTSGPVASVIDARGVQLDSLSRAHRDCAVDALARMRPAIADRYVAQAFVVQSIMGRAFVGMLHLFVRPALKSRSFRNLDAAIRWADQELERAR